jgi:hypothetical protein
VATGHLPGVEVAVDESGPTQRHAFDPDFEGAFAKAGAMRGGGERPRTTRSNCHGWRLVSRSGAGRATSERVMAKVEW